jgi:single-strand DNA-binding protein
VNAIVVTDRLGRDPEARYSKDGNLWATVSVAEGRGEEPTWFEVTCFNRTAEVLTEYGSKGRQVALRGQMAQERYEAKDGGQRKAWRLIADWVEFLDSRKNGDEAASET